MKKQVLIAAIAATMTTVSIADVSVSGKYMGDYTDITGNSNYTQKIDLSVQGKTGDSLVVINLDMDSKSADAGTGQTSAGDNEIQVGETYLKTKILGVNVKAGSMKGLNGNGLTNKSSDAKSKIKLSKKIAGVSATLTSADEGTNLNSSVSLDLSGEVVGVKVKVQDIAHSDKRTISASTEMAGVKAKAEKNKAFAAYQLSTKVAGVEMAYVNIDADSSAKVTQDDGVFGNISSAKKVSGVVVATGTPMGKVSYKNWTSTDDLNSDVMTNKLTLASGNLAYSLAKSDVSDATFSAKLKFSF